VVLMAFFAPPSVTLPTTRWLRVQLCSFLCFGARVVYSASNEGAEGASMVKDSGYYTFVAHDCEHVVFFTTDCESFVDMLEHAVTTRELENDFGDNLLPNAEDPHAQKTALTSCSALENYVVEMTVLAVHHSAMLSGEDSEDGERRVVFQWLCRDFKILDSQRAPVAAGEGHLIAGGLFHLINSFVFEQQQDVDENERLDAMYDSDVDIDVYASESDDYDDESLDGNET